jgi:kynurenine formamidase
VTRAVLVDVPRHLEVDWLESGFAIQPEHLDEVAAAQRVEVGSGDVVLVRAGQLAQVRAERDWGHHSGLGPEPGLGARCGAWLAARDVAAVASDTWGLEVFPYETADTIGPPPARPATPWTRSLTITSHMMLDTKAQAAVPSP